MSATLSETPFPVSERRIEALDGLRGLATIGVVLSHYFSELPGGIRALAIGWLCVDIFFVMSGFLVGRLILEKSDKENFLPIFYVRRICRTFPIYFACVLIPGIVYFSFIANSVHADTTIPFFSYLTFTQNFFMANTNQLGAHWLSPTWTMAIEEQFYLLVPIIMIYTPRKYLIKFLFSIVFVSFMYRLITMLVFGQTVAVMVLLPARADALALGLLAGLLYFREDFSSAKHEKLLRIMPLILILVPVIMLMIENEQQIIFKSLGLTCIASACAIYILSIAKGAPESQSLKKPILYFFARTSFAIYLTHMPILWLMHGLILGAEPALLTTGQLAVSLSAIPLCLLLSLLLTKLVEEPITAYGRSFKWKDRVIASGGASLAR